MPDHRPVSLITGAGSGIGRATAVLLAKQNHRIALAGRRADALNETGKLLGDEGRDWIALPTDVSVPDKAFSLPDRAFASFGRLDAVINNAGWTPMKPIEDHTPENVAAIFGVNAIGPVLISIVALRLMKPQGSGCIVNISSMASDDPFPGLSVYGAAKASLNTLVKGITNEAGSDGIRAFSIAPGAVETDLLRSILSTEVFPESACLKPEDIARVIAACVLGERDDDAGKTIWLPNS